MQHKSKNIMYDHSAAKVRLLKEYMSAYLGILANTNWVKEVYIYDLFCGPGIYDNQGEGSPIIFLKEIIRAYQSVARPRNSFTTFNCLFNDIDKKTLGKLKNFVASNDLNISKYGHIRYQNDDFKIILDEITKEIANFVNQRGFVFIDPYGYKEVSLNNIKNLTSTGKIEVLLFMPTHHMYRFKDNGTPECLINFMEDLEISNKIAGVKGLEFIEIVKDGFQTKLGNNIFVDSFVIKRELNQFFCLFFFTSNMLGYVKMLEAKWKIDKEEGEGWQGLEVTNLFSDVSQTANTNKLKERILSFLAKSPKTNGEVFEFVVKNRYLPKHGTQILKSIQDRLDVRDEIGNRVRKGVFYLTYENYKKSPNKIKIHLKWHSQK